MASARKPKAPAPEPGGDEELKQVFEKVSLYFSQLAEPTRLNILHALCDGEKAVGTVVDLVGSSQTNVSRHLNAMYHSSLLSRRKESNSIYYAIADQNVVDLCRSVCLQVAVRMEEKAIPLKAVDEFMTHAP